MEINRCSYLVTFIALVMLNAGFTSCSSGDNNETTSNPLVGMWRAENTSEHEYWELTFNSDFTWKYKEYDIDGGKVKHEGMGTYDVQVIHVAESITDGYITSYSIEDTVRQYFTITNGNRLDLGDGYIYYKIK